MTEEVFRSDAYATCCEAQVVGLHEQGIELDRTVFYPMGGGQPGDVGMLRRADGTEVLIADTRKGEQPGQILHVPAEGAPTLSAGDKVVAEIDWQRRYRLMRMHTCLHVLCAVVPGGVTGGSVGDGRGRLDFDLIEENHPVRFRWITDEEMAASPDLVRTMSVKPPSGQGRVRLVEIENVDLQPCGGTHLASTGEIGRVRVAKIEKKGRHNRRVVIVFDDA
jgi:misacylated tRNA(Ala) deacylase